MDTRIIELRDAVERDVARNERTAVFDLDLLREGRVTLGHRPAPTCEVAFVSAYDTIRETVRTATGPGLAVFAVDDDGVAASGVFKARKGAIQSAIVGRHSGADLFLPGDPNLSLRHLAVVMHPVVEGRPLTWRVLDLRTAMAFWDERGERQEHLEADGPVFLQVGQYALLFLPLDAKMEWKADPLEAWQALPERVFRAEPVGRRPSGPRLRDVDPETTGVQVIRGPRYAQRGLAPEGEERLGELHVSSPVGQTSFVLGASAARAGVLLGRYHRCDNAGLRVLRHKNISRVHLLILEVDGLLYGIDTASTNGVWSRRREVRHVRFDRTRRLELGSGLAELDWTPME